MSGRFCAVARCDTAATVRISGVSSLPFSPEMPRSSTRQPEKTCRSFQHRNAGSVHSLLGLCPTDSPPVPEAALGIEPALAPPIPHEIPVGCKSAVARLAQSSLQITGVKTCRTSTPHVVLYKKRFLLQYPVVVFHLFIGYVQLEGGPPRTSQPLTVGSHQGSYASTVANCEIAR